MGASVCVWQVYLVHFQFNLAHPKLLICGRGFWGLTLYMPRVSERFTESSIAVIARGAGPSNGDRFCWFYGGSLGRPKRGRDVQRSHQKVDAGTACVQLR
jgi:hypothetical protein